MIPIERIEAGIHWQRELAKRLEDKQDKANALAVANDLHQLLREVYTMARTFAQAAQVLIDDDKAKTQQVSDLNTANGKLADDLKAAQANAVKPEDQTAQQAVIDAAAAAVPEAQQ